ncbi:tetraacyldisaccharide 4'-kinase [Estrella lausannensis]|uniref:tetraacyldisaccharide 4'-kinase n=1 Tax=Estrella lausannensis TaxID=483423 RepID=UPI0013040E1D|nr:tetraacyldisaccharide 4'-kinase [Estrella lausannensis]
MLHKTAKILLAPLGYLYLAFVSMKNFAYDKKIFKPVAKPAVPLISIGNITVGGTGKTPLTILLAKKLSAVGKGAVLTRGYRSSAESAMPPLILTKENCHLYTSKTSGDEPRLIAKEADAFVVINKRRERSLLVAESLNAKWVILDDGMQRRSIPRDLEIITLSSQFVGNRLGFPAGPLREAMSGLKRADLIVITKNPKKPLAEEQKSQIRRYSQAPLIETEWMIHALCDGVTDFPLKTEEKIAAFCGIGNPKLFFETLENHGFDIVQTAIADDHRPMSAKELAALSIQAARLGAKKILCTEKDFVKIAHQLSCELPVFYTKAELQITSGSEALERSLAALFPSSESSSLKP